MAKINGLKATTALFLTLNISSGAIIPLATSMALTTPAVAQSSGFSDVNPSYWAADFINALVQRGIIAGFPDRSFQPEAPVTRAQFAAMVAKAFPKAPIRDAVGFVDVPSNYWARGAIQTAYEIGFLSGYPNGVFSPDREIPREQVLVSLANGLNYSASGNANNLLSVYSDAAQISNFAREPIAAATERQMVVSYPSLSQLNPTRNATRAEVAASIYQALVSQGRVPQVVSQYIVAPQPIAQRPQLPAGTIIPVTAEQEKILLTKEETLPLTLAVTRNLRGADGTVLIPRGSQIAGTLQPVAGGTQFVAQQIALADGRTLPLEATSAMIAQTESVRRGLDVGNLVKNAALGTAAAAAIAAVTGDRAIATEELLMGTGAGVLATLIPQFLGLNRVELLSVQPAKDLALTLGQDFVWAD
jgi:hypothetical protein